MKPENTTKENTQKIPLSGADIARIKSIFESFLSSLGVQFDAVEVNEDSATGEKIFVIKTNESGLLIGENGETLYALTHLLRRMAQKGAEEMGDFSVDINDYKSSMVEKLKMKAGMLAERARSMRANVELEPMSSYERLIIHGTLSGQPNIKTESIGVGKDRRVVIKYIESII